MDEIHTAETLDTQANNQKKGLRKMWANHRSTLYSIFLFASAFATALLLNAFVFQPYEVEGSSMEPTLQNSDRLIVVKAGKTWSNITNNDYSPGRGEIIVFKSSNLGKQLIKRVVGVPGDRVVVDKGVVTIFNTQNPDGFSPDSALDVDFFETTQGLIDTEVTNGTIFVIGDNRLPNASQDSRSFGLVDTKDIVGKLSLRMYPFNKLDAF